MYIKSLNRLAPLVRVSFTTLYVALIACTHPLCATPDLTITGYIMPEDGLGKIPMTILETLGDEISTNITFTRHLRTEAFSPCVTAAIENPDTTPGKITILTDAILHSGWVPASFVPQDCIIKLAYSMFETSRIPDSWVRIMNADFDAVIVPDQYFVDVYQECGVTIPIFVLPIPMMLDAYYAHPMHPDEPSTPFVFLDASANKNPLVLIRAFALAFGNNPDVQLHLRAGALRHEFENIFETLKSELGLTNVHLQNGFIPLDVFRDRLASADCYVNLSRGEGFSFIPREALSLGVPVIVTDNTALSTICNSGYVRSVPSRKKCMPLPNYREMFNEDVGQQFDCEVEDAAAALLDVYENYSDYIKKAQDGRKWVDQYNCTHPELQKQYRTLIKPKQVILGIENKVETDKIITTSLSLYDKYQTIINSNK